MTAIAERVSGPASLDAVERVLVQGDLGKLTADQRLTYYREVCASLGLNPLTQPFEYIELNRKLRLYATKDCAAQLRRLHTISLEIVSREVASDIVTVHARATMPVEGGVRTDEDYGAVSVKGLAGEALANAMLKAVTKAKRRVTLSICGLGFLDESEIEDADGPRQEQRNVRSQTAQAQLAVNGHSHGESRDEPTVYDRVCDYERRLVERGLCHTGELTSHIKRTLGGRYPGLLEDWPPVAEQDVRAVCKTFHQERKAAAEMAAKPAVTAEHLDQLEAELERTGESWQRVLVRLSLPQDTAGSDLTQEQWQEAMDCLGEMPDRVGGTR